MMSERASAPRFQAYFQYAEARPVLHMPRTQWNDLQVRQDKPVPIDVTRTPMGRVASDASVVVTYAQRFSTATSQVAIVRYDVKDMPKPYNVDNYEVWEDLPSHRSFPDIVAAASTEDNQNLRTYLADNVFFVKLDPGSEHHLGDLPTKVEILFR